MITGAYTLSDGQEGNTYCDIEASLAADGGSSSGVEVPASTERQVATNTIKPNGSAVSTFRPSCLLTWLLPSLLYSTNSIVIIFKQR